MIKILNGRTVMLGLSSENIRRLTDDQPMKFNLNTLGLPDQEIIIFTGKDEQTMMEKFKMKPRH